jgi:hypothetical protein
LQCQRSAALAIRIGQVQLGAFDRGDDHCRGAGDAAGGQRDALRYAERRANTFDRGEHLGRSSAFEISSGDREVNTVQAAAQFRQGGLRVARGASRIVAVRSLQRVIGNREVFHRPTKRPADVDAGGKKP